MNHIETEILVIGGGATGTGLAWDAALRGDLLFGNMDTWVIWWLTGGPNGGVHVTDVSNASRTMLMNLQTLDWDADILTLMGVPRAMLPAIKPSSAVYGDATGELAHPVQPETILFVKND